MKILMLSEDFLPNVGGITSHIVYLSKALVSRGHEVTILKPSQKAYKKYIHEYGFSIIHLKKRLWLNKRFIRNTIDSLVKEEGFDVVHWHQLTGSETQLADIPKIFTNHTSMYLERYETDQGRDRLKNMLQHADAVISPSLELQYKSEILEPRLGNYYIPNGVDEKKFNPALSLSVKDNQFYEDIIQYKERRNSIVLCPRRLEPKCGVDYFVQAIPHILESHPSSIFVIAGRGGFFEEERRMKAWLEEKKVLGAVLFLGDVENTKMPYLYALSDVVVFPSLMEATSISCLEAMASGKAIVSTDVGGLPELLEDNVSGLLVKPRDFGAIAEKVSDLISDEKLRRTLGANARCVVEKSFTWDVIAKQTEDIYKKVFK